MAKKRWEDRQPVGEIGLPDSVAIEETAEVSVAAKAEPIAVTVEVPVAELIEGQYISDHLELRLAPNQKTILRRIRLALTSVGQRLANAKAVESDGDAVRWMLDSAWAMLMK